MRGVSVLLSVVAVVLAGWVLIGRPVVGTVAQEGTPAAEERLPLGAAAAFLAGGPIAELPQRPGYLVMVRLTLEPGAVLPPNPNDPTFALVYVESGTLTIRSEAAVGVARATPGAEFPAEEELAAGTELTLGPGDSFVAPPNVHGELRNDGTAPAVLLMALAVPAEAGAPAGTPTP